ncbi:MULTISPECIES: methyltransferase domain-containing protein [Protofrankia]|nr:MULTISPECIES: methyltransferase domain-containing protein [Protofrankia]
MVPLNRAKEPERWQAAVDSDAPVIIQVDDGADTYGVGRGIFPTSSSSASGVMKKMLDMLDVQLGMDVLEIGTGTGYNAALIAERSKTGRTATIEVDPVIADHARATIARLGIPVTIVTDDGTRGYSNGAPYDRIMATASVSTVPYAWVEQTRPGGRIVLPLAGSFGQCALLSLTVTDDGTARGRFQSTAAFMKIRSHRDGAPLWWTHEDNRQISFTPVRPREVFENHDAGFALGLACPGMIAGSATDPETGIVFLRLSHARSRSWASFADDPEDEGYEVLQCGPRRLWEELEAAYHSWINAGRPRFHRFGMTVTPHGQEAWLGTPGHIVLPVQRPAAWS